MKLWFWAFALATAILILALVIETPAQQQQSKARTWTLVLRYQSVYKQMPNRNYVSEVGAEIEWVSASEEGLLGITNGMPLGVALERIRSAGGGIKVLPIGGQLLCEQE